MLTINPMILEFKLPPIGEGVDSADIAEILISSGDVITAEPVVMELETEKAVIELTCPHEGVVQDLAVSQGDTITVGQTLFTIDVRNGAAQSGPKEDVRSTPPIAVDANRPSNVAGAASRADEKSPASESAPRPERPQPSEPLSAPPPAPTPRSAGETVFALPNIGEGVETAEVAEIHVSVGDVVAKNDIVMDLETEKAVVELPCDQSGTITAIHVSPGDVVAVGRPLLTLAAAVGEGGEAATPPPIPPKSPAQRETVSPPAARTAPPVPPAPAAPTDAAARLAESPPPQATTLAPVPAAPSTRRLARQLGVDLRKVQGSGPGGRITPDDVQSFVRRSLQEGLPSVRERSQLPCLLRDRWLRRRCRISQSSASSSVKGSAASGGPQRKTCPCRGASSRT